MFKESVQIGIIKHSKWNIDLNLAYNIQHLLEHPFYKYVEQSRVVESPLPRGTPKSGPLGLDSLLGVKRNVQMIDTKIQFGRDRCFSVLENFHHSFV